MTSLSPEFRRTAIWRIIGTVSSIVTSMLAYRLYKQYLGPSLFGLVITAVVIVGMLPNFDGGYRLVINRRLLAGGASSDRLRLAQFAQSLYSWGALAAGLLGIVLLVIYGLGPNVRNSGPSLLFYVVLGSLGAVAVLSTAQSQLLIGLGKQRQLFILNALASWLYLGTLWILFRQGEVLWAFPVAQFVVLAVPTALAWHIARRELPGIRFLDFHWSRADHELFRELWRDAAPAFVCQLIMLFLYSADSILAVQLLPKAAASDVVQAALLFTMLRRSLQSADESIWPRLAASDEDASHTSAMLVRLNSVVYGVTMTVAAMTLPAFITSYTVGPAPELLVIILFAVRYLVTGLASQPAYYLYGHGHFRELSRHLGLELMVATVLSIAFAPRFGAVGVAGAFTLATLVGVAVPLPWAYTEAAQIAPIRHFIATWARALPAVAVAWLLSRLFMRWTSGWPSVIAAAAAATLASFAAFAALAWWRTSRKGNVDAHPLASNF